MKSNKLLSIVSWVFVALISFMALVVGVGANSIAGAIVMLVAAVMALPIPAISNLWKKVLGIKEVESVTEPPAKWWQIKKKKAQKVQQQELKQQRGKRALKPIIIAAVVLVAMCIGFGNGSIPNDSNEPSLMPPSSDVTSSPTDTGSSSITDNEDTTEPNNSEETKPTTSDEITASNEPSDTKAPVISEPTSFDISSIPTFTNKAYVKVNNNIPYFTSNEYTTTSFESYSNLDSLGRCGTAFASIGRDLMPTEARGSIGSVKPSGWHTVKYDCVDGKYLYNRCHLIGFQLTAENANTKNLITGTRYMNVDGMLPFENMVADYIKETNNHVMYRVTPIFEGNNLVATGVLMEAYSVEDNGKGIQFCVFCYNSQPSISINYANGDSSLSQENSNPPVVDPPQTEPPKTDPPKQDNPPAQETTYVLNTNTKKFHYPSCSSAKKISDKNRDEFTGSRDELLSRGYEPCGVCHP